MSDQYEVLDTEEEATGRGVYCVSVFLVDRAYGGSEEGGWWYCVGEPVLDPDLPMPLFTKYEDVARAWAIDMQATLDVNFNQYRRSVNSVLSEGRYSAIVSEGWPEAFPKSRPYYE